MSNCDCLYVSIDILHHLFETHGYLVGTRYSMSMCMGFNLRSIRVVGMGGRGVLGLGSGMFLVRPYPTQPIVIPSCGGGSNNIPL